jgi:hypothetical protein
VDELLPERVEPRGRLVEDEQLGPVLQRLDEPDLLPVALRERPDRAVELELEPPGEALGRAEVVPPAQAREEADQLPGGEPLVEPEVAGDVADPAPHGDPVAPRVEAEDLETTRGRPDQVEQQADGRRLPGAVRAEEAEHLAGLDLEVELGDAALAAVALGQGVGAHDRGHRPTLTKRRRRPRQRALPSVAHGGAGHEG